mgnify:CR=1 FL=1
MHERVFVRAISWLIEHDESSEPAKLTSPNSLSNAESMREPRHVWGTRIGLPATKWMLEIGPVLLRTETERILKSRRVAPRRLVESGFAFDFPTWPEAAFDFCRRRRENRT